MMLPSGCPEPGCPLPSPPTGAHACPECRRQIHGICGTGIGDEGYGQSRICTPCKQRGEERAQRQSEERAQRQPENRAQRQLEALSKASAQARTGRNARGSSKRKRLSFNEKFAGLKRAEVVGDKQASDEFEIGYSTLRSMKKQKLLIENKVPYGSNSRQGKAKSAKGSSIGRVEEHVLDQIQLDQAKGFPITLSVIQAMGTRARSDVLSNFVIQMSPVQRGLIEKFKASRTWAQNFVSRQKLRSKALFGQAGSVDVTKAEVEIAKLRDQLATYEAENIFNMDETGIFYRILPKKTYLLPKESVRETRGTKAMHMKERITAILCTSATGVKLPMCIIGTAKSPRIFRTRACPLPYFSQKNAWADSEIFKGWFEHVFLPFVRKQTSNPVALIMDNCSSHEDVNDPHGQVRMFSLPPNVTSVYQPLDLGVIAVVKANYRHTLLRKVIDRLPEVETLRDAAKNTGKGMKGIEDGHHANILDAAEILYDVWKGMSAHTIKRCFLKSTILPPSAASTVREIPGKSSAPDGAPVDDRDLPSSSGHQPAEGRDPHAQLEIEDDVEKIRRACELLVLSAGPELIPGDSISVDEPDPDSEMSIEDTINSWLIYEQTKEAEAVVLGSLHATLDDLSDDRENVGESEETLNTEDLPAVKPPPSLTEIATMFAPIEALASECRIGGAGKYIRKARAELVAARKSKVRACVVHT